MAIEEERRLRFDALFKENVAGVASYCGWRSRSSGDEQDAVAEVFLTAWRRLDDVPDGEAARPWLYATARRVMANQVRANARRAKLHEKLSAVPVAESDGEPNAGDPLAELVYEVLSCLKPLDREVLLLAEWEGLSPTEIAIVMRCPIVTARGRLHRARRRFRAAYDESQAQSDASEARRQLPGGGAAHLIQPSRQIASER
jgi:RNA polymerase sigma-70 factor (ECF subfamily)